MQRLVDTLADAPYRVIVSKGPQHELLRLPDTMAGEEFLPQTSILPQVDAVITHGGNNTVTECLHFGKPMVVLPLFWDQYDNAQRVHETGFGLRLDTYGHAPEELLGAVDAVLADEAMRERLATASARLQAHRGTERAAELIEAVAERSAEARCRGASSRQSSAAREPLERARDCGLGERATTSARRCARAGRRVRAGASQTARTSISAGELRRRRPRGRAGRRAASGAQPSPTRRGTARRPQHAPDAAVEPGSSSTIRCAMSCGARAPRRLYEPPSSSTSTPSRGAGSSGSVASPLEDSMPVAS